MNRLFLVIFLLILLMPIKSHSACYFYTATNLNFGNYDVSAPTPIDSTFMFGIFCTANTNNVIVSIGQSQWGGINPRRMKHTTLTDDLNYNLYSDAARTIIWGDGTGRTSPVYISRVRAFRPVRLTVYGRLFAGQDVSVGNYTDTVILTVNP